MFLADQSPACCLLLLCDTGYISLVYTYRCNSCARIYENSYSDPNEAEIVKYKLALGVVVLQMLMLMLLLVLLPLLLLLLLL